ncbi:MAG: RagB/SusD family nutrient uptake outer membrane protein [Bacteroidales bacterium]|nr:RagB/SusD family nutrient uptake outer membrane protein [Bacteroidales bacterium]
MKRFKYLSNIALLGLMALGAASCDDFLTLYPQDRVVEENFWEDKNDLESVRYGAYKQMASTLNNLIIWGDIRSDAYSINPVYESAQGSYYTYKKIVEGQLDSTLTFYDWGSVYTTINYCNKVISHGEEVLQRDPQFTRTEWEQMKAEMTALRALNYFYLLRAFKDIPYSNTVINSDEDVRAFAATPQMAVLDTLIQDVRQVAGKGRNRNAQLIDTRGLMTNTSIYALLAEMYLWRSALREGRGFSEDSVKMDADSVIYFGQKSLDFLAMQNQQLTNSSFDRSRNNTDDYDSGLTNAPLIKNEDMENSYNAQQMVNVPSYNAIFANGNSDESIFELQFSAADSRSNDIVNHFWGHSSGTHFASNEAAMSNAIGSKLVENDCRMWYSCMKYTGDMEREKLEEGYCLKWTQCLFGFNGGRLVTNFQTETYNNWIFYRQTDVMLMMAEAFAVIGEFKKCRDIVDAIQKRNMLDQETGLSTPSDKTKQACIELVMKERLIEFVGEGKRWFDLVRYAERIGGGHNPDPREPQYTDGADGVTQMVDNYLAKGNYSKLAPNLKNYIKNRYGLYCPIYYKELRANKYLIRQNPVWDRQKGIGTEETTAEE